MARKIDMSNFDIAQKKLNGVGLDPQVDLYSVCILSFNFIWQGKDP